MSKIRRDPPPAVKKTVVPDRDHTHSRTVIVGVLSFAVAILIAIVGISSYMGWTPRHYTVEVHDGGGL